MKGRLKIFVLLLFFLNIENLNALTFLDEKWDWGPKDPDSFSGDVDNAFVNWEIVTNQAQNTERKVVVTAKHKGKPHDSDEENGNLYKFTETFPKSSNDLVAQDPGKKPQVDHPTKHKDKYTVKVYQNSQESKGTIHITGEHLLVTLDSFLVFPNAENKGLELMWETTSERNNGGFRLWRIMDNGSGDLIFTTLEETSKESELKAIPISDGLSNFISSQGNEEGNIYQYVDVSINTNNAIYYYLIEDYDLKNNTTNVHCEHIVAVTVGQVPTPNLDVAKQFCLANRF